jgi:predicted enzyme related to lactoylglutathione lyase
MKTISVNAIDVYVVDLHEAVSFYIGILGLEDCGESAPGHMCRAGDLHIYLQGGCTPRYPDHDACGICPVLGAESITSMRDHLAAHGVLISGFKVYSDEFAMFKFRDPCGNLLAFAGPP